MVVVVLGGVNMDFIVHSRRLAAPGETREGERFDTTPGGKGANQAVAAARILEGRVPVEMAGLLGEDPYSPRLRGYLRSAGVGTSQLATAPGAHCGIAVILIDGSGENRVNAVYGANLLVRPEHGVAASRLLPPEATEPPAVLLVQHEVPLEATRAAMTEARLRGAAVILDPAPSRPGTEELLTLASIVTPNQHEAEDLTGITVSDPDSARAAARAILARGPETVIVTIGESGAWLESGRLSVHVPAAAVTPVATVGAGDAFNGGLAAGLALGEELAAAARRGAATAALCVTRPGVQEAMPSRLEVEALLAQGWSS